MYKIGLQGNLVGAQNDALSGRKSSTTRSTIAIKTARCSVSSSYGNSGALASGEVSGSGARDLVAERL